MFATVLSHTRAATPAAALPLADFANAPGTAPALSVDGIFWRDNVPEGGH